MSLAILLSRAAHCAHAGMLGTLLAVVTVPAIADDKGVIAPPVVFRVGAFGAPCTHATLTAAITAASTSGSTIIRLANNQVYNGTNINLSGKNITLEGGYADCAASTPGNLERTTLFGAPGANDSVIEIIGGATPRTVVLRNLDITGGEADADGGGGVEIDGTVAVTFDDVLVRENASNFGGGVHLDGAAGEVSLRIVGSATFIGSTTLGGNTATGFGGGIYCLNAGITVDSALSVSDNSATSRGGGLLLDNCDLTVGVLAADNAVLFVHSNTTAGEGGGIFASNGSLLTWRGGWHRIESNRARVRGGGLMLTGALTSLFADSTSIVANVAEDLDALAGAEIVGGGLALFGGASADFDGGLQQPCIPTPFVVNPNLACAHVRNNRATTSAAAAALGGAAFVDDSTLRVRQTRVSGNSAGSGTGIYARGDSEVRIESVLFDHNQSPRSLLSFIDGVDATVAFATIAAGAGDIPIAIEGVGSSLALHNSVLFGGVPAGVVFDGAAALQVSCVLAADASPLPIVGVPLASDFLAEDDDDYRPTPQSQLLDRCTNAIYAPTVRDALGVQRPVDDEEPDDTGPYDIGAYEGVRDAFFGDSFEDAP